jgi:hypothetical protein
MNAQEVRMIEYPWTSWVEGYGLANHRHECGATQRVKHLIESARHDGVLLQGAILNTLSPIGSA